MNKKNSRIDLKDKSGWISSTILLVLGDFFSSYETGTCKNCFGPLKVLNNPIQFIFVIVAYLGTNYVLFKFILKSEYIDSSKKIEKSDKPLSTKANVYIFLITVIAGIMLVIIFE